MAPLRLRTLGQSIRLFLVGTLVILMGASPYALASETAEIPFSTFLLTWDVLQEITWKQWKIQFPIELYQKSGDEWLGFGKPLHPHQHDGQEIQRPDMARMTFQEFLEKPVGIFIFL